MGGVGFEPGPQCPASMRAGFEVLHKPGSVLSMSLTSKKNSCDTGENSLDEKSSHGFGAMEHFYSNAGDKGRRSELLPIIETAVSPELRSQRGTAARSDDV